MPSHSLPLLEFPDFPQLLCRTGSAKIIPHPADPIRISPFSCHPFCSVQIVKDTSSPGPLIPWLFCLAFTAVHNSASQIQERAFPMTFIAVPFRQWWPCFGRGMEIMVSICARPSLSDSEQSLDRCLYPDLIRIPFSYSFVPFFVRSVMCCISH